MEFGGKVVEKVLRKLQKHGDSGFRFAQKLDAIRKFILPSLDYSFANGQLRVKDTKLIDREVRSVLNSHLGNSSIKIEIFGTSWKDGGLGVCPVRWRNEILTLNTFCSLASSPHANTRRWLNIFTNDEAGHRGFDPDGPPSEFLNWALVDGRVPTSNKSRSTIVIRAAKAAKRLGICFNICPTTLQVTIADAGSPEEDTIVPRHMLAGVLTTRVRKMYWKDLCQSGMYEHSFTGLQDSPTSNFFLKPNSYHTNDKLVSFAVPATANSLPTPERMALADPGSSSLCSRCHKGLGSLAHILNGCITAFPLYMYRHNLIVGILYNQIQKSLGGNAAIHLNTPIRHGDAVPEGDSANLRPDMWYFDPQNGCLEIVEVSTPYGGKTWEAQGGEKQVERVAKRVQEKAEKYRPLALACTRMVGIPVHLRVIVISCLGAIPQSTIKTLQKWLHPAKIPIFSDFVSSANSKNPIDA